MKLSLSKIAVLMLLTSTAWASSKNQKAFGFGPVFYSGSPKSSYSPTYDLEISYSSNVKYSRIFMWKNRFDFGMGMSTDFAGVGPYFGINGTYSFGPRINFAREGTRPYIEFGPTLAMFGGMFASPLTSTSQTQSAFKYGYAVGSGFDSQDNEESSGWGINVTYFRYLPAGSFDFPVKSLTCSGVKLEFRFISPISR